MDGGAQYNPRTVDEVFRDFKGRRAGMIKALTTGRSLCSKMSCFCVWFPRKENGGDFQILVCCVVLSVLFFSSFLVLGTCTSFLLSSVLCSGI